MAYYLRSVGGAQADQVWRMTDEEAVLLGTAAPRSGPGSHYVASGEEGVWDAMRRQTPWFDGGANPFHRLRIPPRSYHPRMARPISWTRQRYMRSPSAEADRVAMALGTGQALALTRRLDLICQTVHPDGRNLGAFGHETRNLLILAATEVEAHWRGILVANGTTKPRLNTADYVRLLRPMLLDAYAVGFTSFPWLPAVRPFAGWDQGRPTASLPWYAAYNAVKHDREGAFDQATFGHAMSAACACVVMLVAQFTRSAGLGGNGDLSTYYRFEEVPVWEPGEVYADVADGDPAWPAVPHEDLRIGP